MIFSWPWLYPRITTQTENLALACSLCLRFLESARAMAQRFAWGKELLDSCYLLASGCLLAADNLHPTYAAPLHACLPLDLSLEETGPVPLLVYRFTDHACISGPSRCSVFAFLPCFTPPLSCVYFMVAASILFAYFFTIGCYCFAAMTPCHAQIPPCHALMPYVTMPLCHVMSSQAESMLPLLC